MPRIIACLLVLFAMGCTTNENDNESVADTTVKLHDSTAATPPGELHVHGTDTVDAYSNQRFKNVYVEKLSDTSWRVVGQAQVFEAAYSWVVEDGHNELLSGYGMTDAGAPAFGNFEFTLNVAKKRPGSTLHLILFESSPKDGSRQHELPVPLP